MIESIIDACLLSRVINLLILNEEVLRICFRKCLPLIKRDDFTDLKDCRDT